MRSRPIIATYITPEVPVPGAPLLVRARLKSRSETPIEGVEFHLTGIERRFSHTRTTSDSSAKVYKTNTHVNLAARTRKQTLGVGEFDFQAKFELPAGLPPSYEDSLGEVRYRLEVRVRIPWWPDRHETFEIKVPPPAWRAAPAGPTVFATDSDGPRPNRLYIEATLDPQSAYLGGALQGAVSLANVTKKLKRVHIGLVAINQARFESSTPAGAVRTYEGQLFSGPPTEGASTPFSIRIPAEERPSFRAALFNHLWSLQLRGEMSWSDDIELSIPIQVAPLAPDTRTAAQLQRLPPVGHERRAKIWAFVANKLGMTNDAASEVMSATIGVVQVRIELEHRDKQGLSSVASLSWPDAGIDLRIAERKWTDRLRRAFDTGDAGFESRFVTRAREDAQAKAFMTPTLMSALALVGDAVVEDDGAILSASGGGHRLDKLERFVELIRRFAAAIDDVLPSLPPPSVVAEHAPLWRRYAVANEAYFEAGSLSLRKLKVEGVSIDVVHHYGESGTFERTTVEHGLDETVSLDAHAPTLEDASAKHGIVLAEDNTLKATVPTFSPDPSDLLPTIAALVKVARALRPRTAQGPYR